MGECVSTRCRMDVPANLEEYQTTSKHSVPATPNEQQAPDHVVFPLHNASDAIDANEDNEEQVADIPTISNTRSNSKSSRSSRSRVSSVSSISCSTSTSVRSGRTGSIGSSGSGGSSGSLGSSGCTKHHVVSSHSSQPSFSSTSASFGPQDVSGAPPVPDEASQSRSLRVYDYSHASPVPAETPGTRGKKGIDANKMWSRARGGKVQVACETTGPKAKIICFKDAVAGGADGIRSASGGGGGDGEDLVRRECKVCVEDEDVRVVFLSCYDPVCWVLCGDKLDGVEKVIICETKHSQVVRECWYPDGSLPRVKGIEKLNPACRIGLEMGYKSRYESDFKASYYAQTQTKVKRSKLITYLEAEYECKVAQIVQGVHAPDQVVV